MPERCPIPALIEDLGRWFADDGAGPSDIADAGVQALRLGFADLDSLLATAYDASEVVATEVVVEASSGACARTVFPATPGPVALLLLCARRCRPGDVVRLVQHTAAFGPTTTEAVWPFDMATAEVVSRPPAGGLSGPAGARLPAPAGSDEPT